MHIQRVCSTLTSFYFFLAQMLQDLLSLYIYTLSKAKMKIHSPDSCEIED